MLDAIDVAPGSEALEASLAVLQEVFGFDAFRGPQADIVSHVGAGGDALVLMPTGGGKSLCYQVPAIVRQQTGHGVATVMIGAVMGQTPDIREFSRNAFGQALNQCPCQRGG